MFFFETVPDVLASHTALEYIYREIWPTLHTAPEYIYREIWPTTVFTLNVRTEILIELHVYELQVLDLASC